MFGKNQKVKDSFEFLELQRRVASLEIELQKCITHINSLRGLINRRSKEIFEDQDQDETIKSPDGLDYLRSAGK
ncbi:unnamed protein product [marine sediment metagenome]|uniref:Uncharacterized protein n=1 Tax=marine sediment metagenome TaxID=412755 RepID=X0Z847_9ZZZZ